MSIWRNHRLPLACLCCLIALPIGAETEPSTAVTDPCPVIDLIGNGDFEGPISIIGDDLVPMGWTIFETGDPTEHSVVSIDHHPMSAAFGTQSVNFFRDDMSHHSGDWTALEQDLNVDVSVYNTLKLSLDVQVVSHNLEAGGAVDPPFEWPATVKIIYEDMDGALLSWQWGFFVDPPGTGATQDPNETLVSPGEWTTAEFNLLEQLIRPRLIRQIVVGGSGWDFQGRADNVKLLASPCPRPQQFIRGDVDGDGLFIAVIEATYLLDYGFVSGDPPPCLEAAEFDGDGILNTVLDVLAILEYGFFGGSPPPAPFPGCGPDPEPGSGLGCATSPAACASP